MITNLKFLAPCSTIANICMATGLALTFYYGCKDLPDISERTYVGELNNLPLFFGTAIFAFEGIALVSCFYYRRWRFYRHYCSSTDANNYFKHYFIKFVVVVVLTGIAFEECNEKAEKIQPPNRRTKYWHGLCCIVIHCDGLHQLLAMG